MAAVAKRLPALCRTQTCRILGSTYASKRHTSDLTKYKRGTGGRSSFSGVVATVFGSSGFLGRYVVNRLGKIGSQVVIPWRGDPYEYRRLKLCGDLGQIVFAPYEIRDEESVRKAMAHSNVVINLIGREWETKNYTFDDVHNVCARNLARIAREMNVETFLHMSSLNASEDPEPRYVKGGSKWVKSKFAGENAVREEFPDAIIFKPADIFGDEDRFFNYYGTWWRRTRNKMPMYKMGLETIKQPVFAKDVAQGIVNAVTDPGARGQSYEIVGPYRYYLGDLVEFFCHCMRWPEVKFTFMDPTFWMKVSWMSRAFMEPKINREKLEREFMSDVTNDLPTLLDLGLTDLRRIEPQAQFSLKPYRRFRTYYDLIGEFPDPVYPPVVS